MLVASAAEKQKINITDEPQPGDPRTANLQRNLSTESFLESLKVKGESAGSSLAPAIPLPMVVIPSRSSPKDDKNWMMNSASKTEQERAMEFQQAMGVRDYNPEKMMGNRSGQEPTQPLANTPNRTTPSSMSASTRGYQDRGVDPYARASSSSVTGPGASEASPLSRLDGSGKETSQDKGDGLVKPGSLSSAFKPGFQNQTRENFLQSFANPIAPQTPSLKPFSGTDFGMKSGLTMPGATVLGGAAFLQTDPTRRELNPVTGSTSTELGGGFSPAAISAMNPGGAFGTSAPFAAPAFGAALDFLPPTGNAAARSFSTQDATPSVAAPSITPQPAVLPFPKRSF